MHDAGPAPIPAADLLNRPISLFASVREKKPAKTLSVGDFLRRIKGDDWRKLVSEIRSAAATDKAKADGLKRASLPAVTLSGVFRQRANDGLAKHSGLMALDLDGLGVLIADARRRLMTDPHVLALFVSPSGKGLKVLVPITATDEETHRACFLQAEGHFKKLGLTVDPTGKDVARLCFVSHDPDAWVAVPGRDAFSPSPLLSAPSAPLHQSAPTARSAPSASSAPLCTTARDNLKRRAEILAELFSSPYLARLYRQFIESRAALPGKRNQFIVQMVPAVYEVVTESLVVRFSLTFYDLNRALFNDDRAHHEAETKAMLKNYRASYRSKLSAGEQAVYSVLDGDERGQAGFRICRDLAKRGKESVFFMSCDELGARIGCDSRQAHRLLCAFTSDGLVEITTPGVRRAQGVQARATEYRWKL